MRMTIDGGCVFDLLDEGDFIAYEVEFEPGELTAHFYDNDGRTLFIVANQPLTEDNILNVGWEDYQIS